MDTFIPEKWNATNKDRSRRALNYINEDMASREPVDLRPEIIGKILIVFFILSTLLIAGCFIGTKHAHAQENIIVITKWHDEKVIKAIIGEAENQGFEGMLAVAHAIRNRGTLQGVYGLNAFRVKHHLFSQKIYSLAKQAWEQSAIDFDITRGADHWENIHAFGCPSWVKKCVETFRYKDHVFYREEV